MNRVRLRLGKVLRDITLSIILQRLHGGLLELAVLAVRLRDFLDQAVKRLVRGFKWGALKIH